MERGGGDFKEQKFTPDTGYTLINSKEKLSKKKNLDFKTRIFTKELEKTYFSDHFEVKTFHLQRKNSNKLLPETSEG